MTTQTSTLTITRTFRAPRARVFAAFTDPALFGQWWGPPGTTNSDVTIDARVGGRFAARMHLPAGAMGSAEGMVVGLSGEFTTVEAPDRLEYSFRWEGEDLTTQVALTFADAPGGGTVVTLMQSGFPVEEQANQHEHGWNASFDRLEQVLA